ncbi:unnamed protein product [Phytophthora lilii]|uniref:Unnamed protein product n=1 Tax=Phytophthora lilii TaxID=2077276 RepID=A0A9W6WFV5_9STRA|nr:unnamed protein product [Phytophthora lilii]
MNLHALFLSAVGLAAAAQANKIDTRRSEAVPTTRTGHHFREGAVKYKPQLHITNGCHAYPVVNDIGQTSGGLQASGKPSGKCKGSGWGSQVYGRSTRYSGTWAIMYAWYFPKDLLSTRLGHHRDCEHDVVYIDNPDIVNSRILAVSASSHSGYSKHVSPTAESMDGINVKIIYESHWPINHELDTTSKTGDFQDLILWHQLTDASRLALNTTDFGKANVPMNDDNFLPKLDKAWPI